MTWFYARYVLMFLALALVVYSVRRVLAWDWLRYLFDVLAVGCGAGVLSVWWRMKCADNCSVVYGFLAVGAGVSLGWAASVLHRYLADKRRQAESAAGAESTASG